MKGGRRQLASKLQLFRQQLLHLSTTPTTTLDIHQAIHGIRPTQAKSLSLGEYVFLTDITFMFTHSFQLSVLILFHCTIHDSLFSFLSLLLVCLKNLEKNQKNSCSFQLVLISMLVVVIKKKTQKDFMFFFCLLRAFPCKQFYFFSFLWGSRGEDHSENVEWLLYALLLI